MWNVRIIPFEIRATIILYRRAMNLWQDSERYAIRICFRWSEATKNDGLYRNWCYIARIYTCSSAEDGRITPWIIRRFSTNGTSSLKVSSWRKTPHLWTKPAELTIVDISLPINYRELLVAANIDLPTTGNGRELKTRHVSRVHRIDGTVGGRVRDSQGWRTLFSIATEIHLEWIDTQNHTYQGLDEIFEGTCAALKGYPEYTVLISINWSRSLWLGLHREKRAWSLEIREDYSPERPKVKTGKDSSRCDRGVFTNNRRTY